MSLKHDFLLLDRHIDGEWSLLKFLHDPRAVHLHDDVIAYLYDTLRWIPTVNPSGQISQYGLCLDGVTLIEHDGARIAERVFHGWANLFAAGPATLTLTGAYTYPPEESDDWGDDQLDGPGYESLSFDRDELVETLQTIAEWCRQVQSSSGKLFLYHGGV